MENEPTTEAKMVDPMRLDTAGVLAAGITNRPAPETDIPEDRERFNPGYEDVYEGRDAVVKALERGELVVGLHYYGIPYTWKTEDGYRGVLVQYRRVTEDEVFNTSGEAANWWERMAAATYG